LIYQWKKANGRDFGHQSVSSQFKNLTNDCLLLQILHQTVPKGKDRDQKYTGTV